MSLSGASLAGGCLCGAARYEVSAVPLVSCHCHCSLCRRASGAPFVTWTTVPVGSFRWTRGAPEAYRSSPWATRFFCGACGSALLFQVDAQAESADGTLDVASATLDDPGAIVPTAHIWVTARLPWPDLPQDGLARFDQDLPPGWRGPA
ncbi:MAG: GFA family protein [Pseudomonadota bacterium]